MARYSRRRGPAANMPLSNVFATVPGFTIARYFDDGEIICIAQARMFNGTAGPGDHSIQITLDGNPLHTFAPLESIAAGQQATLHESAFQPIDAGAHRIELQALGVGGVGDSLIPQGSELFVIQLPRWDTDTDLVSL